MTESQSVYLTFSYAGTDFVRKYVFNDVADQYVATLQSGVKAINASLAAGTAGGLDSFFVANNGNSLQKISVAQIDYVAEEDIDLTEEGE